MKIIFTGASSFTGYWFVAELARSGHDVTAVLQSPADRYEGVRKERVHRLASICRCEFECSFGDERFLDLVKGTDGVDVLCHHAAHTTDYSSADFDLIAALQANVRNVRPVFEALASNGCRRVVLTGSVFEKGEGAGSEGLRAFSPYGLSKGLTAEIFEHVAATSGIQLGKFVIPNPFGPLEEARFTSYLVRTWYEGQTALVNTPAYVRDNIHVSLLAKAYVRFLSGLAGGPGFQRINPSGYAESQGAFSRRFAEEMRSRLGLACRLSLKPQTEFPEPRVRINLDVLDPSALGWSEEAAWEELAAYYRWAFGRASER
jgi:nucleoside-diphosphate-sugar epimerase